MLFNNKKISQGFTLVELLVVVSIMGLLATLAIAALQSARQKGRDARRQGDMKQIKTAIELYFDANGFYPQCAGNNICTSTGYQGNIQALAISPTYMVTIPTDPRNSSTVYGYYYARGYKKTGPSTLLATGLNSDYVLATRLELPNDAVTLTPNNVWDNVNLNLLLGN
ncbi:MAG TPA: prepilin-type N-terminal cleavage/methylation domain-containing protein [bacterium]|nr:prepilin-type N-terminal cleavage/methylation domain-containing protein [bacterium]